MAERNSSGIARDLDECAVSTKSVVWKSTNVDTTNQAERTTAQDDSIE